VTETGEATGAATGAAREEWHAGYDAFLMVINLPHKLVREVEWGTNGRPGWQPQCRAWLVVWLGCVPDLFSHVHAM
jgi:hypothetical protein